jgi:hypothetical protein
MNYVKVLPWHSNLQNEENHKSLDQDNGRHYQGSNWVPSEYKSETNSILRLAFNSLAYFLVCLTTLSQLHVLHSVERRMWKEAVVTYLRNYSSISELRGRKSDQRKRQVSNPFSRPNYFYIPDSHVPRSNCKYILLFLFLL